MAKKVRNLLLLGAAVGAAAAGTYYYLKKRDESFYDEDEDDAEDFDAFEDDDLDGISDSKSGRNYVPLHFDASAVDSSEEEEDAKDVTLDDMHSVEEFYDDDDEDEEMEDETPIDTDDED